VTLPDGHPKALGLACRPAGSWRNPRKCFGSELAGLVFQWLPRTNIKLVATSSNYTDCRRCAVIVVVFISFGEIATVHQLLRLYPSSLDRTNPDKKRPKILVSTGVEPATLALSTGY